MSDTYNDFEKIAIVGLNGRFPKAKNIREFWENLREGADCISRLNDKELECLGVSREIIDHPQFVRAGTKIEGADLFDASFFGMMPKEAEITDPQHRLFLECAWEALEIAGYCPETYSGLIGVFAGCSASSYIDRRYWDIKPDRLAEAFTLDIGNQKDYLATKVSYKLNLKGSSLTIQTACSTSLVAVHLACHALLTYQCDIALAGGVSINASHPGGYFYEEGMILSSDGYCRAFDRNANGTVIGQGVGIVVLKRLSEAIKDGDDIYAVIRGSGINNDGSNKVGYTAPSIEGQAKVILSALACSDISAESITYVETHGTGTRLGDPIEIAALTQAFGEHTGKRQFCAIGSVKTNIGHLDAAAGVAGLIKSVLMLKEKEIPPSLYFKNPNPNIDFESSPFFVNTELRKWERGKTPLRAGVSSFGIGGTNAHVVLEEAPELESSSPSRSRQLLLLSAKTDSALKAVTANIGDHLTQNPTVPLADVAYTLQTGRKAFSHRRFIVCHDANDAVQAVQSVDPQRVRTRDVKSQNPEIVFMFPGQGAQYVNMGSNLYDHEAVYRGIVDRCSEILKPLLGRDLRSLLFAQENDLEVTAELLRQTCFQQPAIFTVEYALAKLWEKWGVRPAAVIGHSIGEYAAACLAEVFSLEDALVLVANRGRMMQELPGGAMLSIRLPSAEIETKLNGGLSLAAVNAPSLCVVSGTPEAVQGLERELEKEGVVCRLLQTSHAFHSSVMDSIVKPFQELVGTFHLSPPKIPFVSTATGTWISPEDATDPAYWAMQLRDPVRFSDGIGKLWEKPERVLLEVGPRTTCATLARRQAKDIVKQSAISSLGDTANGEAEWMAILNALGQLWLAGVEINWEGFYEGERRRRVALPTYPFERKRFWIEPADRNAERESKAQTAKPEPREEKTTPDLRPSDPVKEETDSPVIRLKKDLEEASGSNLTGITESTTFIEMGFDSLFLTQWTLTLKKKYGVRVPVPRLFDDLATLGSVAGYILKESSDGSPLLAGLTGASVPTPTAPPSSRFLEEPGVKDLDLLSKPEAQRPILEKLVTKQLQVISELLKELGNPRASMRLQEIVSSLDPGSRVAAQEGRGISDKPQEPAHLEPAPQAQIERVPRKKDLSLSPGQQRLWYLDQLDPMSPVYNLPEAFKLTGKLDLGALRRAVNGIIERHEVLRTTYRLGEGGPGQLVSPSLTLEVPVIDFSHKPQGDREVALAQYLESEALRPFDLSAGPLVRASMVKLADEEHILFFMPHHSVFDGWSWAIFQRELFILYEALVSGKPSPLAELPVQYADFAHWQKEWLQGKEVAAHLSYWREKLSDELPVLDIPADFARPASQPIRGSREALHVPQALVGSLTAMGRSEGATFFMVLLAVFQTLLGRYSGQEDVIVGSPISGRTRPEASDLIGFFVNTLVFRTNLAGNPTFRELLRRVREVCLGAYRHQELPFERLVEEIQPERDLSRTPIYQAMLVFTVNMVGRHEHMGEVKWTHHKIPSKVAQTDLNLWVMEADGGLELELEYYTDLFKADTIKRMMKHLEVLLGGILADPDKRIGDLPILTKEELKQLEEWNTTHADYPREACVQQLFEDQVEKTPENGAVVYEGSQLTYLELNQRANRLAHYLRELGVGPDVPVGIYMDRCGEMFVALFGVLKAGGAYVPLDPEYPKERLTYMMEDAQLGVILTQERLRDEIPANSARVVFLDGDWQNISQYSDIDPPRLTKPGNLMYVIYTSGSTGKPKGVEVPHGAVVNFLLSMAERPGFVQQDVLLAVTTLSFDIHVLELYLPLMVGAKTVILSREAAGDGMTLLKTLQNSGATVMQATPATWRLLLSAGWKESADLKVLCGGEAFPPDLAMELVKRAGSVWNMYGPTETTVWSTCYEYKDGDAPIPIGRPIANTTVYILDKHQQPVPVGVPGELYIGGAGVARGYRNRSDLTKERFIADPFSQDQKARLYKTGDLARYRSDGNLEYLNRMDNQVKVRGFRIELGEIETALGEVDAVKQGVVIAREIKPGDTRLIAYFIPVGGKSLTPTDLRSHLRKKLPEYMIPQHFVELDKMPLTPAGKIDRKGLPSPWGSQGGAEPEYVPPRNEAERILASIWQEVLGIDRVSAHDNFFDLGGHSLLCIQVIERIIKETGIRLSPRTILLNNLSQIGQELKASLPPKETFAKKEAEKNGADSSPGGFLRKMKKKFFPHSH